MSVELIPLTAEGFAELQIELEKLKTVERPEVIKAIAVARAHGDLKENAEYHAAREKQGFIEARVSELEDKLSRAQVIDYSSDGDCKIRFGAWVTLCNEETSEIKRYRIVGDLEADLKLNKLSLSSPMAKALLGKEEDDLIEIKAPKGIQEYVIEKVEY